MSSVQKIRLSAALFERSDFGPFFNGVLPAVLLAAIFIKFSVISAPGLHLQVIAWAFSLLACWFALGKGVFLFAHTAIRSGGKSAANLAFAHWLRSHAGGFLVFATAVLAAAGFADLALSRALAMDPDTVLRAIAAFVAILWLVLGPPFLVMCAASAQRGNFAFGEALDLTRGIFSRCGPPWLGAVMVVVLLSSGASLAYAPLRALVVAMLPSVVAIYIFSVAFYAAVITAAIGVQAVFATWVTQRLLAGRFAERADRSPALSPPPAKPLQAVAPDEIGRWRIWRMMFLVVVPWIAIGAVLHFFFDVSPAILNALSVVLAVLVRRQYKNRC